MRPQSCPELPRAVQSCPELLSVTQKKRVTDGPTDKPSYRDARTHLKIAVLLPFYSIVQHTNKVPDDLEN